MARYQSGHVFEAHGAYHVRYYETEIVDGKPQRVQRSKRLCTKDNKHHSVTCKAVKQLAATEMEKVNSESGVTQHGDTSVTDFWDTIYLPHVEKTTKPSTLSGYKAIWRQNLSAVFAGRDLTCRQGVGSEDHCSHQVPCQRVVQACIAAQLHLRQPVA
jgi:hypothetical protein